MHNYFVEYSGEAEKQYDAHLAFVADFDKEHGTNLVGKLIVQFENADKDLEEAPLSFQTMDYHDYRRLTVDDCYIMMYVVIGNKVLVDKILDMRSEEYNDIYNKIHKY